MLYNLGDESPLHEISKVLERVEEALGIESPSFDAEDAKQNAAAEEDEDEKE